MCFITETSSINVSGDSRPAMLFRIPLCVRETLLDLRMAAGAPAIVALF